MVEICILCGQEKPLQESHIIPKFVGKWLKETSATGFLAKATDASKRVQDLITEKLLCTDCEEHFSKFETYFANQIFYPFHNKQKSFEYDERLKKFAVSLCWRILKIELDEEFKSEHPNFVSSIDKAESIWRDYLLGNVTDTTPFENHLIFFDYAEHNENLHEKFNSYTLRSVDGTLVFSNERLYAYVKLPWMAFVSSILPEKMEGWDGTFIHNTGVISNPQQIRDPEFGGFLQNRIAVCFSTSEGPSEEQALDRLLKAAKKDPQKFLESETLEGMIARSDNQRKIKMKNMPLSIISLVEEVILRIEDNPSREKAENNLIKWQSRQIADALANLSADEAASLESLIFTTINQAHVLKDNSQTMLKAKSIWVVFMVHPNATKDFQRKKISDELEELVKIRGTDDVPIAAFAMNPSDEGVSWESGFALK